METFEHNLPNLSTQLGLPNTESDINDFVSTNRLEPEQPIIEADCWTPSQIEFLMTEIENDSQWCIAIDELNERMSETPSPPRLLNALKNLMTYFSKRS